MNLINFLNQIDGMTEAYSKEQLCAFIHTIGRGVPEKSREDFLRRFKEIGKETASEKDTSKDSQYRKMYARVEKNLEMIASNNVWITSILNEEYDDWYDDVEEEFYYEDHSGVSDMLAEACDFVRTSMDMEQYKEGFEVGSQLFSLKVLCANEEYGDDELSLEDMVHYEILYCDVKRVVLDTLYCAYYVTLLKNRPKVLYEVIKNAHVGEITLEALMQHGEKDLPEFQEFLPLWIRYLGKTAEREADSLMLEAVGLLNDVSIAAKYAEQFVEIHPGIYLNLLENSKNADAGTMISIGMRAIHVMPKKYVIRSKIALQTAEYVIEANEKQSLLEECYFAAYESDTTALNYLRVLFNGADNTKKREKLQTKFMPVPSHTGFGIYDQSERKENKPCRSQVLMLKFLDGQFDEVLKKGLNASEALGWSDTFMKQGIALFLLYLYEGPWKEKGILAMAECVKIEMDFSVEEYQKGRYKENGTKEDVQFYDVFSQWKSMVPMEEEVRARVIEKITQLIAKRTEGIMNANRRNYYGECAAYIAALGEVQESLGNRGAKQKIMTGYKEKYPRRSLFRAAMKEYGWIDGKKK